MAAGLGAHRIVVHARWCAVFDSAASALERLEHEALQWSRRAGPLFERATALGGRLLGWGPLGLSVDFSWDALYDAIDFLVDTPLLPELASGISHGPLVTIHESPRLALATGEALHRATRLAELAQPGEILVCPLLVQDTLGRLGVLPSTDGREERAGIPALILDPTHPLDEEPDSEIPASVRVRSSWPTSSRRLRPPDVQSEQVARLAGATEAVQSESSSTFPEALASALRDRSQASLSALAHRAEEGPPTDAKERMSAMAQLVQGQGGDALRRLRAAKQKAQQEGPAARCRAALALAVALAALGRNHEAVLEGLSGLARAREAQDEKGERACVRLLASLAASAGDEGSAQLWASVCS